MVDERFARTFHVGWAQVDFNQHMVNAAYLNLATDTRLLYFESHGFPVSEFMRLQIGPVVLRDSLEYFAEFRLLDRVTVTFELAGLSEAGAEMRMRNEFLRADGKVAARLTSQGLWLDLAKRRPTQPPPALVEALRALTRSADFETLPRRAR